jgi:hypothetical protein
MRSPTFRSTSRLAPARAAGAPPRTVELKRFHQAAEKRVLGSRPAFCDAPVKNGDARSSASACPMLAAQGAFTEDELKKTALANLGWWHHSVENTIDKLDFAFMQDHLRVYAAYLWSSARGRAAVRVRQRRRSVHRTARGAEARR